MGRMENLAQNYLLANLAAGDFTNVMFFVFFVTPTVTVLPDRVVGIILCKFFVGFRVPATAIGKLFFYANCSGNSDVYTLEN